MEKKYIIKLKENEIAYKTVNSNGCPMIGLLHPAPYTEPDLEQVRKEAYDDGFKNAVHNCPEGCPHVEHARNEAYQRGVEDGAKSVENWNEQEKKLMMDEAYQNGISDMRDALKLIEKAECVDDLVSLGFDVETTGGWSKAIELLFEKYSPSEIIEKIRQYEQKQEKKEIQVGGEVIYDGKRCVVVFPQTEHLYATVIDCGRFHHTHIVGYDELTKTGRHFPELVEILQKMRCE